LKRVPRPAFAVELTIVCEGAPVAAMLNEVLLPDNRYFPSDQVFRTRLEGASLKFSIGSPRVRPALSTVSSILSDSKLFCEVHEEVTASRAHPV
jgi:hypothetical protein